MRYNPLNLGECIEKTGILTNRIIVKALQSDRGDIIRAMNVADLKMMKKSVTCAVSNKLAVEAQLAHEYECVKYVRELDGIASDPTAEFKPRSDVEIEEEVTAYFEINGKLQYREVAVDSSITLPEVDKSIKWVTRQIKMGKRGMRYNPYSLADRLEKAEILANDEIIDALLGDQGDSIRPLDHDDLKQLRKEIFSIYYHELYAEAADNFDQACEDYVPERDGIENDPRKNFRPKTEFEIDQEIKAYFEELDTFL